MNHRQVSQSEIRSEDETLRQILLRILDKWRLDEEGKKEELEKTVILSSKGIEKEIPLGPIQVKETQEVLPETVILSRLETSKEPGKTSPIQKPQEEPKEDLFLKETIILKPDRGKDPKKK
jgi:hypothetical protein